MKRLAEECAIFALALQFMTRLPVPAVSFTPARLEAAVRWYPGVGVIVGALSAVAYAGALLLFPTSIAALLAVAAGLLVTGVFHEDGLTDTVDGIGGGQTAQQSLEIFRDSRIGAYGAAALFTALALKAASLAAIPASLAIAALPLAHAASRASVVVMIATSRYVRADGLAKPVAGGVGPIGLAAALGTSALAWFLLGMAAPGLLSFAPLIGLALGHALMRLFFEPKLGGYTGDCLGAVQQASELGFYLGLLGGMRLLAALSL